MSVIFGFLSNRARSAPSCSKKRPEEGYVMIAKSRNSAIELLRILSMLLIVGCHFATYGGFSFSASDLSCARFLYGFWELGGNLGTDIFVLISGYYLIENDSFSIRREKAFRLWAQIFFWSLLLFAVSFLWGAGDLSGKNILRTLFPVTFSRWWFASTYFVLYLLHPFLNRFLRSLSEKDYRRFLLVLLVLFCVLPTLTGSSFGGNELTDFIVLYTLAGYIKLHRPVRKRKSGTYFAAFGLFAALTYLSYVILILFGTKLPTLSRLSLWFYERDSLLTLGSALSLFFAFSSQKPFENRAVNTVASACFGVYLLHEHPAVRTLLWGKLFCGAKFADSPLLPLFRLGAVAAVYAVFTGLDLLRKECLEKPLFKALEKTQIWNKK